ncbi:MAG TPA: alpha-1,4-glucan--maltose-1-phosphate maltosyltransferase [Candidatus Binatia bacterium]|nr:alpha-1,4-glucan--maltose-1-phosphate maltosyltransferase [Candidatus Binatia bacterium]
MSCASTRRVVVEAPKPVLECGTLPAKATVGLPLTVAAAVFADGHDLVMGWVRHGRPGAPGWHEAPLLPVGNDRFSATFVPSEPGPWAFEIVAMPDAYGTWLRDLKVRIDAGQEVALELEEGARMADRAAAGTAIGTADRSSLEALARSLRDSGATPAHRLHEAGRSSAVALMRRTADRGPATLSGPWPLTVERQLAGFGAWYEMFPRSEGADPPRSGTFRTAASRLPGIAAMGFDIVYLPPIHPIGRSFRKGRNNSLDPGPEDVGSPWAIGAAEGGHTAVHPDLGAIEDFRFFVGEARRQGLEVALDYALQCSPDHPWLKEHPEWFRHRVDGSIRYAENPPKRYQDIYPFDFDTLDRAGLWAALLEILRFWIGNGVRIFRVDNPHTKPFAFWEWLIAETRRTDPDVIFLAEAFTRPAVMQRLAKVGFSQSYTYFTWRTSKIELTEYLTELSQGPEADWFRPNFWVNTPDILHAYLQHGGPAAFRVRATLAAITAPSWGMYSGYELGEHIAVGEGSEEYLDSEKYQLRPRDWDRPDSLAPYIARLNQIRHRHREAIALLPTLRVQEVKNDNMLCVSRMSRSGDDVLLLVLNLDPLNPQAATTWLDLEALGIPAGVPFEAHDELTGATYVWQGPESYVRLDPAVQSAHVLHLRPQ